MSELAEFDQGMIDQAMGQLDPEMMQRVAENPQFRDDKNLHVRFFYHPHPDAEETKKQGRPVYRDKEYIEIIVPGDRDNTVNRPVRAMDKARFPDKYSAFKRGLAQVNVGTPLEIWPAISRAQVEELKFFKVFTVEQLANMPDALAQQFMGFSSLRTRAKDFLDAAKGTAQTTQLREAMEQKDAQIGALSNAVKELTEMVKELKESRGAKNAKISKAEQLLAKVEAASETESETIEDDPEDR